MKFRRKGMMRALGLGLGFGGILARILGYLIDDSGSYIVDDNGNRIKGDL